MSDEQIQAMKKKLISFLKLSGKPHRKQNKCMMILLQILMKPKKASIEKNKLNLCKSLKTSLSLLFAHLAINSQPAKNFLTAK